ncbi:hypothetical protein [Caballeronia pedi]|nr:hypothetical protein [Caballeronia pedi]
MNFAGRDLLGQARNLLKIAEELQMAAKEMDGGMTGSRIAPWTEKTS